MENESTEKLEKPTRTKVSMALEGIPMSVHRIIKKYKRKISASQDKNVNIRTAYVEFLKEVTKTYQI